jgi:hypothetical protein
MDVSRACKRLLVVAMAAALPLVTVIPASAADAVNQKQTIDTGANTLRTPMAQTFKAVLGGQVDRISLEQTFTTLTENVQIQGVTNGKPDGSVLGSSWFTGALGCCRLWKDFTFNPTVSVAAGTEYAIVVVPSTNLTWYDSYGFDAYPDGQMWLMVSGSWAYQTSYGRDFTFQEWLTSGSSNRPPVLTESSTSVTAPEGSTATMTGTYQDPDGDNVALSASPAGTLTKTGTSAGTWTWSQAGADESPVQQVTIMATDGHGGTTPVMFNVSFTPVTPTVTIVGAPSSGSEGTGITLTAKATSPSAADQAVGFNYSWTVSKNGSSTSTAPVTGSTFTFAPDDEGSFAVTLTAVDDGGNGASVTATITGMNVDPKAVINSVTHSGILLLAYTPITIEGGFTDVGALDTHTAKFDYGDGSPVDATTYGASGQGDTTDTYAFRAPGTYTVTYTVTDDDNGSSAVSVKVTVETPEAALGAIADYIGTMSSLDKGEKNGLMAKYRAAAASAARGDNNATCGQLGAALNDLSTLTKNGRLSQADSDALASATWAVHRALGCTKVKVAWLNLSL